MTDAPILYSEGQDATETVIDILADYTDLDEDERCTVAIAIVERLTAESVLDCAVTERDHASKGDA